MPRVKRGVHSLKKRRKVLGLTKGYRFARSKKERAAREAMLHAGKHAFFHRRKKKREFRKLFQIKIGAAAKENGTSYSKLIGNLKKNNVLLDRKILAELAEKNPKTFNRIVEKVGK